MYVRIFLFLFSAMIATSIQAQTVVESEAYKKKGLSRKTSLLKPKYPSYSLAATYVLTEKARKGDPFAQHELGIRYILGIGVPIDSVKAAYWIGKAAAKRLPAANFNYGLMLNNGIGVEWNPFEGYKNFLDAAESGMEQSQYIVGLILTDNLIVNKNLTEAQKWLKKSADKGFEEAKKVLEEFIKRGFFVPADSLALEESEINNIPESDLYSSLVSNEFELDFYNFSEDSLSEPEEQKLLEEILSRKRTELKKMLNVNEAEEQDDSRDTTSFGIIDHAASSGSPEALLIKARLSEYGVGVKQNYISAATSYLKAFRLGSFKAAESLLRISQKNNFYSNLESSVKNNIPDAMFVWAGLIALGLDYSLTEEQAFDLLKKAETNNHLNSIIELGLAYYSGSLVEKDSLKAIEYFESAAEKGSSEAKIRLAFIHIKSGNNSEDNSHINILREYANKGSVLAEAAMAYCYEKGIGIEKNKAMAAKFYRQAAQRGNEAAYNSLRNMYDEIRPSDEEFQIYM